MRIFSVVWLSVFMLLSVAAYASSDTNEAVCSIEVTDMAPDGFADTTRPVFSATLSSECGNDIDVESIELRLNDEAVPCEVTGSGSKVSVNHLPKWNLEQASDHFVMIRAKDEEGNTVEREWTFWLGLVY